MSRPSHFSASVPAVQRGDTAAMYRSRNSDPLHTFLGAAYQPPEIFEHGRETLVAQVAPTGQNGANVRVFEARAPAAWYVIEAGGFRFSTGAGPGVALVVDRLVNSLASGMLVVEALPQPEGEG